MSRATGGQPTAGGESSTDAGPPPTDAAGPPPADAAGPPPADAAGPAPEDASGPAPMDDAHVPVVEPDAYLEPPCEVVEGDLLQNGGFESWVDDQPEGWGGTETNLPVEGRLLFDTAPRCGVSALRLVNQDDGHERLTVRVPNTRAGRHTLVYWVRGHGEIRNAWYGDDYSSYQPAGYISVDSDRWERVSYSFSVDVDYPEGIEVVFSLRNTQADRDDLQIDEASLVRLPGLCDDVVCEDWAECDAQTGMCSPRFDRCADDAGCPEWAACEADHRCVAEPGRCADDADCAGTPDTALCDPDAHTCVDGDPCAGVECRLWQMCSAGACVADPARCRTSADCQGDLPVCDAATATCNAIDHAANLVRNGGFEVWNTRPIPFHGEPLVPDFWYGLDTPADTEIDPDALVSHEGGHSGALACQIVFPNMVADRFATESFNLPGGNYTCGYWVRGHGTFRHRWYSGSGWSPMADFFPVDSDAWQLVTFAVAGNLRDLRLIFYASNTLADRGHIQLDDVFCTRNP